MPIYLFTLQTAAGQKTHLREEKKRDLPGCLWDGNCAAPSYPENGQQQPIF